MKWIPPRSMADRTKWFEDHPWIAGCYVGFFITALLTVWGMVRTDASIWFGLAVGIPLWILGWVLFAVLAKRRFGERPNGDSYPQPTWRRPWTRVSDGLVFWFMVFGVGGLLVSVSDFFTRPRGLFDGVFGLVVAAWIVTTTWAERRRRRDSVS